MDAATIAIRLARIAASQADRLTLQRLEKIAAAKAGRLATFARGGGRSAKGKIKGAGKMGSGKPSGPCGANAKGGGGMQKGNTCWMLRGKPKAAAAVAGAKSTAKATAAKAPAAKSLEKAATAQVKATNKAVAAKAKAQKVAAVKEAKAQAAATKKEATAKARAEKAAEKAKAAAAKKEATAKARAEAREKAAASVARLRAEKAAEKAAAKAAPKAQAAPAKAKPAPPKKADSAKPVADKAITPVKPPPKEIESRPIGDPTRLKAESKKMDEAFDKAPGAKDNFVKINDLQKTMPHLTREEFVAVLNKKRDDGEWTMNSHEGRHGPLTAEEKAASLYEGPNRTRLTYISRLR